MQDMEVGTNTSAYTIYTEYNRSTMLRYSNRYTYDTVEPKILQM